MRHRLPRFLGATYLAVVVLAAAGFLAVNVSKADAAPFGPAEERVYQLALDYWGMGEPAGCTSVTKEILPPESLGMAENGDMVNGRATQPAPGTRQPCILQAVWVDGFPGSFCDTVVHETGHLHGFGHSMTGDVMTHGRAGLVPPCAALQRRVDLRFRLKAKRRHCRAKSSRGCWAVARRLRRQLAASS